MMKYKLKCPKCGEEFEFRLLSKDFNNIVCQKCHTPFIVSSRVPLVLIELALFYTYINFIHPYFFYNASITTILIGMVFFCGVGSICLLEIVNKLIGIGYLFEVKVKEQTKAKNKQAIKKTK